MKPSTFDSPNSYNGYPGQYVAPTFTTEKLMHELRLLPATETLPLVNILELPDNYIIEMAAPGLQKTDFDISLKRNILTIACVHNENDSYGKVYCLQEFKHCCFTRDIVVPGNIDADFLSAEYRRGILIVSVPKSKEVIENNREKVVIY